MEWERTKDTLLKRARYIEKYCEIIQEFRCAHPVIKTKINRIYNSLFPGSVLWYFSGRNVKKLKNSWSVAIRHMWELGGIHAKSMLYSRFIYFLQSIRRHSSNCIGLYSLKFIKPYGQREAHSQEKCGWRKVMVEMENVPPKCKGKYYGSK